MKIDLRVLPNCCVVAMRKARSLLLHGTDKKIPAVFAGTEISKECFETEGEAEEMRRQLGKTNFCCMAPDVWGVRRPTWV